MAASLYGAWNDHQSGRETNWAFYLPGLIIPLIVLLLFLIFRLDSEVRPDGVYVRFFPLATKLKRYGWEEIDKAYIRTYSPLREYGGWGVRYGAKGKALNVSGNQGLQLELKNNKRLLIGTRRPEALAQALTIAGRNH